MLAREGLSSLIFLSGYSGQTWAQTLPEGCDKNSGKGWGCRSAARVLAQQAQDPGLHF